MGEDYRVNLDVYNGPLDLLLYLIRRDEIDIYDIPIARITAQYVEYVELLKTLDPNLAGDFLVMAATLMEVKTRMLLPAPPPAEGDAEGVGIDPRAELVRQLLQYKAFKDAAGDLRDAADEQARRYPRRPGSIEAAEQPELDLEDVQVWDLMDAFSKILESIGKGPAFHEVIYDDTPLALHEADILDRLRRDGEVTFTQIFEGRRSRSEVVGLFMAILELVRVRQILIRQDRHFGEITVGLNPNPPTEEQLAELARAAEPAEAEEGRRPAGQASPLPAGDPGDEAPQQTDASAGQQRFDETPAAGDSDEHREAAG